MVESVQLPWKKFDEEEIQHLIAMLFFSLDYHIQHLHKSDRANENGADIVVKKDQEDIAIAVKIKPDQKDRYQLIELSRRSEKRKIYVHIETPTKKFLDSMKEDGKDVEFWDVKKLNNFFFDKNPYFASFIIFDNHSINEDLVKLKEFLFLLWDWAHEAKDTKKPMDKESTLLLWRLKDSAVTLNQTSYIIERLFEEPFNIKNKEYDNHFTIMFMDYLDRLSRKLSSFLSHFMTFFTKNQQLVLDSIRHHQTSSHWLWVGGYKPLIDINSIKKDLKEATENRKLMQDIDEKMKEEDRLEIEKYEKEAEKGNDVWKGIHNKLKSLHYLGEGIEYVVDDILLEHFDDPDRLDVAEDLDKRGIFE